MSENIIFENKHTSEENIVYNFVITHNGEVYYTTCKNGNLELLTYSPKKILLDVLLNHTEILLDKRDFYSFEHVCNHVHNLISSRFYELHNY